MDKERAVYFGIVVSLVALWALVFLGLNNADVIKRGATYFFTGSTKEDPFCFSWAECPSASEPDAELVSAPMPTPIPGPTLATKPENAIPIPEPTPVSTATLEPVPVALEEQLVPTPVIHIPEIQYNLKPLEDNSHPTPPEIPAIPDPQFKVGQLVQWVTNNYSDQGHIASFQYDGLWIYEIEESGSIELVSLAENRLSVPDIRLPFKANIIGREVEVFDDVTGEFLGDGAVEEADPKGDGWEYLIRRGNCGSFEATDARLVLINKLPMRCIGTEVDAPSVPIAPTPTPTLEPDATPVPLPSRAYDEGDLVRWVVGGGNVHQGK